MSTINRKSAWRLVNFCYSFQIYIYIAKRKHLLERLRQSTSRKLRLQPLKRENYLDKYILNQDGTQRYFGVIDMVHGYINVNTQYMFHNYHFCQVEQCIYIPTHFFVINGRLLDLFVYLFIYLFVCLFIYFFIYEYLHKILTSVIYLQDKIY